MYQLYFNGLPIYDPRGQTRGLIITDPDVHLAVGEAGSVALNIDDDNPAASLLTKLDGVLELRAGSVRIFKGRITKDTRDFDLTRRIEAEGLLACLNDSVIPPYNFPDDFLEDAAYQAAAETGNVVEFFLEWVLAEHNSQVGTDQQKIVLGDVTVSDPNNYIPRASSEYLTSMEVVKKKLVDLLGGHLLPDYSGDTTVLHYYDTLPTTGDETGRAFRDVELEQKVLEEAYRIGLGAQFGGKYMAHDVRIIRLPRHGASCPVGLGVSCSADRNIKCKINKDGIWIEKMDDNPGSLIPEELRNAGEGDVVRIDLNRPMPEILAQLSQYPVATRLSLNGTIIVGRDIAHAKLKERLDRGEDLPQYIKDHPIYYAGPAKTPAGMACGSMGPTTAGRMDSYVDLFQSHGGSMVMLAKGNRAQCVTDACQKYGGFYLGSIGGPAAILAQNNIKSIECVEYPELGMEAIWKIEVEDFPAFILVDDKGNDFFKQLKPTCPMK